VDCGDETVRAVAIERRDLTDIGTADKGALAGASQHYQPQLRVRDEASGGLEDFGHQRPVEAVQLAGIVDHEVHEVAALGPLLAPNRDAHRRSDTRSSSRSQTKARLCPGALGGRQA
jgi:hypothetical protein